jgi:drug/metabolite transporter (DMT)-like permease
VSEVHRPSRLSVAAALVALYLIWGSTYLAILIALETLPPFLTAGVRFLVAGALLYGWARFQGAPTPERRQWGSAAWIGGLMFLVGNGGVVWSETRIPSSLTALLIAMVPMWFAVLEWVWLKQRPGFARTIGLLIGLGGVALLVDPAGYRGGADPLAALAVAASAFAWATGSLCSRRALLPSSGSMATATQMIAGGVFLLALGAASGEAAALDVARVSLASVLAAIYLLVFGSLVGFTTYAWLLRVTSTGVASTYAFVNPAVAVALGWGLAGEAVNGRILVAGGLIIVAVVILTVYRRPAPGVVVQARVGDASEGAR